MSIEIEKEAKIESPPHFWRELWRLVVEYLVSEDKLRAWSLLLIGLFLTGLYTYLVPYPSKMLGEVVTALSTKDAEYFWRALPWAIGFPFITIGIVALIQVFNAFLSLYWRRWMTKDLLRRYFTHRAYYHLTSNREIKNPDQRIQIESTNFTTQFRGLFTSLILLPGTIISGSIALWQLSPTLVIGLTIYGIVNLIVSYLIFAKPLSRLNFVQQKVEANFRTSLVRVRENAEAIAFYRGEEREENQAKKRFDDVFEIRNKFIRWYSIYFNGYEQIIASKVSTVLPFILFVPLIASKQAEPGILTQAIALSSTVAGSWFGVANYIDDIARLYATTIRLISLRQALDNAGKVFDEANHIQTIEKTPIAVSNLTLQTPDYQRTLFQKLNFQLPTGEGMLVVGESGAGKSSLMRAIAGLWDSGTGEINRPPLSEMLFLSQKPYMTLGTLRKQLLYPSPEREVSEDVLCDVLKRVKLGDLPEQVGGFEAETDWAAYLSPGQQQRLAFARVLISRPKYVVLDESTSALDVKNEANLYAELQQSGTTFLSVAHRPTVVEYHKNIIKLGSDGEWELKSREEYLSAERKKEEEADEG